MTRGYRLDSTSAIPVLGQIGKFAECAGDLSYVQIVCVAAFVSLNNSSIVSFCCFTKISRLGPWLKFKVRGREIGRARQTFQSGCLALRATTSPSPLVKGAGAAEP